jgi:ATP-dependent RNA circularization protein (DNA/RNA ligase family)
MNEFLRFPHTPHLDWLGVGDPRDDKVLAPTDVASLLGGNVVVEEKLDGANLGFSAAPDGSIRAQNRGQYLARPFAGQFSRLGSWLASHEDRLQEELSHSLTVFGEWCTARHSLEYDRLPDWWLMFDVYDRSSKRFWSTTRRNELADKLGVAVVPCLHRGHVSMEQLRNMVVREESCFRSGEVEGLMIRKEDAVWLKARAKLVHPDFTQAIAGHWRARPIEWNSLNTVSSLRSEGKRS